MSAEPSAFSGNRRLLLLAGAGLGGLLLGLMLLFNVFSRPESVTMAPPSSSAGKADAVPPEIAPPGLGAEPSLPQGRNPFGQLVVPVEAAPGEGPVGGATAADGERSTPPASSGPSAPPGPSTARSHEPEAPPDLGPEGQPSPSTADQPPTAAAPPPAIAPPPAPPAPAPTLAEPPVDEPPVDEPPVVAPEPRDPPVLWSPFYWKWLMQRFEPLRLFGTYGGGDGMTRALVGVDRHLYSVTEQQSFGDRFFVERIALGCLEVSDREVSIGRAVVRICTATGAQKDLMTATSVVIGKCVELRGSRSWPPEAEPTEPLERRIYVCHDQDGDAETFDNSEAGDELQPVGRISDAGTVSGTAAPPAAEPRRWR